MIQLTEAEYKRLLKRDEELSRLERAGVDNWEGYPIWDDEDDDEVLN